MLVDELKRKVASLRESNTIDSKYATTYREITEVATYIKSREFSDAICEVVINVSKTISSISGDEVVTVNKDATVEIAKPKTKKTKQEVSVMPTAEAEVSVQVAKSEPTKKAVSETPVISNAPAKPAITAPPLAPAAIAPKTWDAKPAAKTVAASILPEGHKVTLAAEKPATVAANAQKPSPKVYKTAMFACEVCSAELKTVVMTGLNMTYSCTSCGKSGTEAIKQSDLDDLIAEEARNTLPEPKNPAIAKETAQNGLPEAELSPKSDKEPEETHQVHKESPFTNVEAARQELLETAKTWDMETTIKHWESLTGVAWPGETVKPVDVLREEIASAMLECAVNLGA